MFFAYIICDNEANLIRAEGRPIQSSTVNYAKILATWMGLAKVACCLKSNNIYLERDSIFTITKTLSLRKQTNWIHYPILHDLYYWILNCEHFHASHVYRKVYQATHYIAQHTLHAKGFFGQVMMSFQMIHSQSCRLIEGELNIGGTECGIG